MADQEVAAVFPHGFPADVEILEAEVFVLVPNGDIRRLIGPLMHER